MKKEGVSTWKVAAAYIGTIVGAGFATGQEVLQFFTRFGAWGLAGLAAITIMFVVFGAIIMDLGKELEAKSHLEIIKFSGGKWIGRIIDIIVTFFLFGSLTAMLAGTGALVEQQFGLHNLLGVGLMALITVITVLKGIHGVIDAISFIVPFLLTAVIGISIYSIFSAPPNITASVPTQDQSWLISNWIFAAILYVSYNTVISIAVLGPLGAKAKSKKALHWGALWGGLGLGVGSLMIYLALSGNIAQAAGLEIPMIYIAGKISFGMQMVYTVILIAEVYTTAVGSLYGLASRLTDMEKSPRKGRFITIGATVVAMLASQFGFSNLVKYLYPLVGYGGIVLLVCLVYVRVRRRRKI